jgi:methionyl-tRNA formyltransferase
MSLQNNIKNIAILTTENSTFKKYVNFFNNKLKKRGYISNIFYDHLNIPEDQDVVFILSYFKLIKEEYLKKHKHNIVVHGSDLPKGKGWSPIIWQIIEGKNKIPMTLFEAVPEMDAGDYYIKDYINFEGHELSKEIRKKQAEKTIEMCLKFLENYNQLKLKKQVGKSTFYKKRNKNDSEININKTINGQFNLLRVVDNKEYPAFFYKDGYKYIIKITKKKITN